MNDECTLLSSFIAHTSDFSLLLISLLRYSVP